MARATPRTRAWPRPRPCRRGLSSLAWALALVLLAVQVAAPVHWRGAGPAAVHAAASTTEGDLYVLPKNTRPGRLAESLSMQAREVLDNSKTAPLQDLFAAAFALPASIQDPLAASDVQKVCDRAASELSKGSPEFQTVFSAATLALTHKCDLADSKVSPEAVRLMGSAMTSAIEASKAAAADPEQAAETAGKLARAVIANVALDRASVETHMKDIEAALKTLFAKLPADTDTATLALYAISHFKSLKGAKGWKKLAPKIVSDVLYSSVAEERNGGLAVLGGRTFGAVQASTGLFVHGAFSALGEDELIKASSVRELNALGTYLSDSAAMPDPPFQVAYAIMLGVRTLHGLSKGPLAMVTLLQKTARLSKSGKPSGDIKVVVTDVFGLPLGFDTTQGKIRPGSIELASASSTTKGLETLALDKKPDSARNAQYGIILPAKIPVGPATIRLELSDGRAVERTITFTTGVSFVGPATVTVTSTGGKAVGTPLTAAYPKGVDGRVAVGAGEGLSLTFALASEHGEAVHPQQVVVQFEHGETGVTADFVVKPSRDVPEAAEKEVKATGTTFYKLDISSMATVASSFKYESGAYAVSVLVADATIDKPLMWHVLPGSLGMTLPARPEKRELPLYYETLLHDSEVATEPLPVIEHQFRQPDSRPPHVVSFAFTGLICLSFVLFLRLLAIAGANLQAIPGGVAPLAFAAVLAATLGLYAYYWFASTMFETLMLLAPLCMALLLTGHQAISAAESARAAHAKQKTE